MYSIIDFIAILFLLIYLKQYQAKYADECMTTTNSPGQCVPMYSCSHILYRLYNDGDNVTEVYVYFMRHNSCGIFNNLVHVCCAKEYITLNVQGFEILNKTECGYFQMPRISHGKEARLFTFPWMALLRYDDDKEPFKCGATLISHRYVLTAGHCTESSHRPIGVRLGEHDISRDLDCQKFGRKTLCSPPVEDVGINEIIVHPDYNFLHNDIALIRLNRSVDFKLNIRAICLPTSEDLRTKSPVEYFVSGWGDTENGTTSNTLQYAVLPHKNLDVCVNRFKSTVNITSNHICAGGESMQDTCRGDSGGPLSAVNLYNGNLRLIQYGVVSYGINSCGVGSVPGVYTNVAKYMQWITDTIRND